MLVLTRRPNESIVFCDLGVAVRVLEVRGKSVRLGVEAPRGVRVLRSELLDPLRVPPAPALV
jgi:carbon storage regulator